MTEILPTHRVALIVERGRKGVAEQMIDDATRQPGEGPRVSFSIPLIKVGASPLYVTHWMAYMWARSSRYEAIIVPLLRNFVTGVGVTEEISPITHTRRYADGTLGGAYAIYHQMPDIELLDIPTWLSSLNLQVMEALSTASISDTEYQDAIAAALADEL